MVVVSPGLSARPQVFRPIRLLKRRPVNEATLRLGCCETWTKPCEYHEGYLDALSFIDDPEFDAKLERDRDTGGWFIAIRPTNGIGSWERSEALQIFLNETP